MEKFGLFDVIEKLAPLKKSASNLLPIFENLKTNAPKKEEPKKEKPLKKSTAPVLDYIRRHEEMSKRIDRRKG